MNGLWSLDARVLVQPASAFHAAVRRWTSSGVRVACRRPLFLAPVLGSLVSLLATGTATLRLIGPAAIYWGFVPLVELIALLAVVRRRPTRVPTAVLIDLFFAGHAAWTLFVIAIAAILSMTAPAVWWFLLTRVFVTAMVVVIAWSAYVDFCFFRSVLDESPRAAVRDVAINRLLTWTVVFGIFAVAELGGFVNEITEAVQELLR